MTDSAFATVVGICCALMSVNYLAECAEQSVFSPKNYLVFSRLFEVFSLYIMVVKLKDTVYH